jgi:hypothetical protein
MRYVGLFVIIGALALVAITLVVIAYQAKVRGPRRAAKWDLARESARWQDAEITKDGKTQVVVRRVARLGHRREVVDQQFIGSAACDRDDYLVELEKLRLEAMTRVYQLNTGPLS